MLGGIATVLGIVPGTENVSNIVGNKITSVKTSLVHRGKADLALGRVEV